jgi:predicted aspartyl protease
MSDEMGMLRIQVHVQHREDSAERLTFENVLVDTGAELSWFPAPALERAGVQRSRLLSFRQAAGDIVERWIGNAIVYAAGVGVADLVVFGEPGDQMLLGARSLEGLNLMVDPVNRRLVDAGPMPAALAS